MVGTLETRHLAGARVLEIGGGVGAIQTELLTRGASNGEVVELVSAYEPYARELAAVKGLENRSLFRVADVLDDPNTVAPAAVVVLNRVVCCSPDGIRLTGIADRLAQRILGHTALHRWGQSTDLTGAFRFLASDAAAYVTGAVLSVDGGYLLA